MATAPNSDGLNRRRFIQQSASAGVTLSVTASGYRTVLGANERLGVAILGAGARAQAHIDTILALKRDGIPIDVVGVCDVWDGWEGEYWNEFPVGHRTKRRYAQGLNPTAVKCGLNPTDRQRVTKDYRRLLDRSDVHAVCIATPDHWHAKMIVDAARAGKHIFCESPLTRTAREAAQVKDVLQQTQRVLTVGVPSLTDSGIMLARECLRRGRIGPAVHAQAGVHRNDIRGMWRFYRVLPTMTPQTIDWPKFLGVDPHCGIDSPELAPDFPFNATLFAQWRTSRHFGNGPLSDLLIHPLSRLLSVLPYRSLRRVTAAGGLFLETDGRDVPDVATLLADFSEGGQVALTATTVNSYPQEEVIRGRFGTMRFERGSVSIINEDPSRSSLLPNRLEGLIPATETLRYDPERLENRALWLDWLKAVHDGRTSTISPAEIGCLSSTIVHMGMVTMLGTLGESPDSR
ncbi:Gfo/Idh/MocA family protein [Tuwongella immobilis]|uniref:Uncharacterized protein n=1 Tax=Tuwongella immobilis TaxID=692036 RepID=A0A6C2YLY7_9BACT|nr:Gfo/Idh/MocA family oxidoreductase [Tuwongella immobilis]VIP02598.1 oxidoreductase domain-containing protein : Putative dehydrogenase OS=Singulisphaera acidiphila (strain ATCC BAA-1392 / DSM 18658 / VKM B-2454 / MOB10) GN=Sinac_5077 PE=4 SV=1: GFO_IDH_MocA [Tuwongella immobilis]VTS01882.1 oxidoreductase domain-containing protein : Putative dehydrogenase OS=Singulisphaera acidiphila (strain ATCC BAA-1392 / DSM 18658 / VKM B-2454 / MOB10) GN=Sinac_5077 PE=4 SV=1: GFO_IDH_MocA [Tuwongella immobil